MDLELLTIPGRIEQNLPLVWTFLLLMTRFGALLILLPGIGAGMAGLLIRMPAIIVLSFAAMPSSPLAVFPSDMLFLFLQITAEFLFGLILGMIPLLIVNGVQMAGHLAGTTMGLQASQLIDPTLNLNLADTGRLFGDLVIVVFLLLGGHYVAVHASAGLAGLIVPGSFLVGPGSVELLINQVGEMFRIGMIVSSPVIVALMLTNFVMGLITKVVPTVNIFIVSFPLTIGIGLILSMLMLPELIEVVSGKFGGYDAAIFQLVKDAKLTE